MTVLCHNCEKWIHPKLGFFHCKICKNYNFCRNCKFCKNGHKALEILYTNPPYYEGRIICDKCEKEINKSMGYAHCMNCLDYDECHYCRQQCLKGHDLKMIYDNVYKADPPIFICDKCRKPFDCISGFYHCSVCNVYD